MTDRILIICAAFVLDLIMGDPHWRFHPVIGIGALINHTENFLRKIFKIEYKADKSHAIKSHKKIRERTAGIMLALIVIFVSVAVTAAAICAAEHIHHYFALAVEIWICYRLLATRSLKDESMKVYNALKCGDVEAARHAVSMIVGRDTERLDAEGINRAAVETVAENTSDGSIAPLIFMLAGGAIGGVLYKAINTMDSMIGYKNDRYIYFGTAAAKLDDIANFIPARISAASMLTAAFLLKLDYKNGLKIFKRDRYNHKSPNSAQTEAVCAGVLDIRLAGDAYYFGELVKKPTIGDDLRNIEPEDIRRACRLLYLSAVIVCAAGVVIIKIIAK